MANMDAIDRQLLVLLQEDARLSYAELGDRVGLSVSAVNERVKKLQVNETIQRYVALVDPNRVELYINAFVQVLIDSPDNETEFIERIKSVPEVQECHCITGDYGYLLKVRAATPRAFEALLKEKIKMLYLCILPEILMSLIILLIVRN